MGERLSGGVTEQELGWYVTDARKFKIAAPPRVFLSVVVALDAERARADTAEADLQRLREQTLTENLPADMAVTRLEGAVSSLMTVNDGLRNEVAYLRSPENGVIVITTALQRGTVDSREKTLGLRDRVRSLEAERSELMRTNDALKEALEPFVDERHHQREGSKLCDWCGCRWPCDNEDARAVLAPLERETSE